MLHRRVSKNGCTRSSPALALMRAKNSSSPLWKQAGQPHGDASTRYSMRVLSKHYDPLTRIIEEWVRIKTADIRAQGAEGAVLTIMNSRSVFRQPAVTRVRLGRDNGGHI